MKMANFVKMHVCLPFGDVTQPFVREVLTLVMDKLMTLYDRAGVDLPDVTVAVTPINSDEYEVRLVIDSFGNE
jgi:hypothetical protein